MPLPDFVVAGERRSGTSGLSALLAQHPGIFMHPKRDRGYFVDDEARKGPEAKAGWDRTHSVEDYAAFFADAGAETGKIIGEKSADYLFWRPAHERLNQYLPEAKFIITLRNPVERAWSHYWNEVGKGRERLSFETALTAEQDRKQRDAYAHNHLSYVARGFYDESLTHFFEHISRDRVLVTTLESLISDPETVLPEICRFLGADPRFRFPEARGKHNPNWTMTPKPWAERGSIARIASGYGLVTEKVVKALVKDRDRRRRLIGTLKSPFFSLATKRKISRRTRAELEDLYKPHIAALESLLDRRFAEWTFSEAGD